MVINHISEQVSDYMKAIGKKGGDARMKTMTAAERSAVARTAAAASVKARAKAKRRKKAA